MTSRPRTTRAACPTCTCRRTLSNSFPQLRWILHGEEKTIDVPTRNLQIQYQGSRLDENVLVSRLLTTTTTHNNNDDDNNPH